MTTRKKRERHNFKEMTIKQKISHLWEYYKLHGFIIILIVSFIIYGIYSASKPKINTSLYVAVVNNNLNEPVLDQITEETEAYLQLDTSKEKVFLNSIFYFNSDIAYSTNARRALITYVAASEVDIIIAPESEFANYAYNDFFHNLTNQLPTDLYTALANDFFISDTDYEEEKLPYGIYLHNAQYYNENYQFVRESRPMDQTEEEVIDEPYVLGIVGNSSNLNNSLDFIRYIFDQD